MPVRKGNAVTTHDDCATFSSGQGPGSITSPQDALNIIASKTGMPTLQSNSDSVSTLSMSPDAMSSQLPWPVGCAPIVPHRIMVQAPFQEFLAVLPTMVAALGAVLIAQQVQDRMEPSGRTVTVSGGGGNSPTVTSTKHGEG